MEQDPTWLSTKADFAPQVQEDPWDFHKRLNKQWRREKFLEEAKRQQVAEDTAEQGKLRSLAKRISDAPCPPPTPQFNGDSDGESAVLVGTVGSFARCSDALEGNLGSGFGYVLSTCPH
jgi:hypothetical protein